MNKKRKQELGIKNNSCKNKTPIAHTYKPFSTSKNEQK